MNSRMAACPVSERRLRPIYECLESGNNKKALQTADRVLKKQPNLVCAKALRCLALVRMGKDAECEEQLEFIKTHDTLDESALQAMTVCYREMHRPEAICDLYEKALSKDPSNEDFLNNLFMAHVRVGDYKQQKLTALNLYKLRPKNQYYFWAVISVLLESVGNVSDLIQFCLVPSSTSRSNSGESATGVSQTQSLGIALAERMLQKFYAENKIASAQELLIFLVTLEMQGKVEAALEIVNGQLGSKLDPMTLFNKKVDLLVKLDQWDKLNALLDEMLQEEPDCWHCYTFYLDSVFKLGGETANPEDKSCPYHRAKLLFEKLIEAQNESKFKKRGPFLAQIEFCSRLAKCGMPVNAIMGDPMVYFLRFIREFGSKECCASELRPYVHVLSECLGFFVEASKYIEEKTGSFQTSYPTSIEQVNLCLTLDELSRTVGLKNMIGLPKDRKQFALNGINRYIKALPLFTELLPTEPKPCDREALTVVHSLFDLWVDTEDCNYLFEGIVVCHFALSRSPANGQFKALLLKLYHILGGSEGAHAAYHLLDIKHMFLDALGYLHVFPLLANASYNYALEVLINTTKFFSNNLKESADNITFAYKYDALTKIPEFIGIKEKLNKSAHHLQSVVERRLLDILNSCGHKITAHFLNLELNLNIENVDWGALEDNRDFSVLWDLQIPGRRLTSEAIDQSYRFEVTLVRLRCLFLLSMMHTVRVGQANYCQNGEDIQSCFSRPKSSLNKVLTDLEDSLKRLDSNIPNPQYKNFIMGPPVSRLVLILQINFFDLVLNGLRFVYNLIPSDLTSRDKCQFQYKAMVLFFQELAKTLGKFSQSDKILDRNMFLQISGLFAELLSFSCVLLGACRGVVDKIKLSQTGKKPTKKKEANQQRPFDPVEECQWRTDLLNQFTAFVVEKIQELQQSVKSEEKMWLGKGGILCQVSITNQVDGSEERNEFQSISNFAYDNLVTSYTSSIDQIVNVLKMKLQYLNGIKS